MANLSLQRNRRIDLLCEGFESSWNTDQRASIETVLGWSDPAERSPLLAELIALEFELRASAGERVALAEYLQRFPDDQEAVATAILKVGSADGFQPVVRPRDRFESNLEAERLLLGDKLGAGGMGVVFRGRDVILNREMAVKVLTEDLQSQQQAVRRFVREARICARLEHPGIIPIHEMGWLGDRPYFTMKLAAGRSLAELLSGRPTPADELPRMLGIFVRMCETMAYAHAHGVVHRDLKPANVMLGEFGEVYVIDWGLAKLLEETGEPVAADREVENAPSCGSTGPAEKPLSGDLAGSERDTDRSFLDAAGTVFGTVVGTPEYMSPEQAAGGVVAVDQRCDVYGLGAVLCEILTGAPPSCGGATPRLETCSADRELLDLTRCCLKEEPDDRPRDAGEVLQRVTTYQQGVEDRLRKTELELARREERRRRQRLLFSLTLSLLFLVSALASGAVWVVRRDAAHRQELARQQSEQEQRRQDETERRETVRRQLKKALFMVDKLYQVGPLDWQKDPLRRTRVIEQARRAETLVETGLAEPADVERVAALRSRIEADDADTRLLGRLDQIRLERTELESRANHLDVFQAGPMCRKAFSIYGLEIPTTDPRVAVEKLRSRPARVAEACVFPLECWQLLLPSDAPESAWIDTVVDQIDDNAWRRKARQACRGKDWPEVKRLLEMVGQKRLPVDTVNLFAMRLIRDEQLELAHQILRPAQVHHPGDFWINHYLGITLSRMSDPQLEESLRFDTAALAILETAGVYHNLATNLAKLQRYSEAEQAFRSAARFQPDWELPHLELAKLLASQGRLDEALSSSERAVAAAPKLARAWSTHGQLLLQAGRPEEGVLSLRRAVELDGQDADALLALGRALFESDNFSEAAECLQRVLLLDPGNPQAEDALEKCRLRNA